MNWSSRVFETAVVASMEEAGDEGPKECTRKFLEDDVPDEY